MLGFCYAVVREVNITKAIMEQMSGFEDGLYAGAPSVSPTPLPELDAMVKRLHERREAWSAVTCKERAKLLRELAVLASQVLRPQYLSLGRTKILPYPGLAPANIINLLV